MLKLNSRTIAFLALVTLLPATSALAKKHDKAEKSHNEVSAAKNAVLWRQPVDIKSRNLFYGPGGEKDAPHTIFTFEKEDREGTSPKFTVHDENGVKWKVKLGHEVRAETVASRLVWAVGYSTNEDYFMPIMHVQGMPKRLHRGREFVDPDGTVHNARLKRYLPGEKKVADWRWGRNPFASTQELNGLRVMMALINNWDSKDVNNAVYREKHPDGSDSPEDVYMVSDLGASFGTTGVTWRRAGTDGLLKYYSASKFATKSTPSYVDFATPSLPFLLDVFYPPDFFMRLHMRWIGKRIPRDDVRWIDQLLSQLSWDQICDAFRAAGYPPADVDGFTRVVENRIKTLNDL